MQDYPWIAAANGIIGYGNSQAEAVADWADQYHATFADNDNEEVFAEAA